MTPFSAPGDVPYKCGDRARFHGRITENQRERIKNRAEFGELAENAQK